MVENLVEKHVERLVDPLGNYEKKSVGEHAEPFGNNTKELADEHTGTIRSDEKENKQKCLKSTVHSRYAYKFFMPWNKIAEYLSYFYPNV